jgi:hypothetical protein
MDFRMSIGVEPMKMRTDRGMVITGYKAVSSARRYAGSVPGGNRTTTPVGSASSSNGELGSTNRGFAADATTRTGTRRERSRAAARAGT